MTWVVRRDHTSGAVYLKIPTADVWTSDLREAKFYDDRAEAASHAVCCAARVVQVRVRIEEAPMTFKRILVLNVIDDVISSHGTYAEAHAWMLKHPGNIGSFFPTRRTVDTWEEPGEVFLEQYGDHVSTPKWRDL